MTSSRKFYSVCGILMLASELWKQWALTYLCNGGSYLWWHFPFQLCSIPMYVCLAIGLSGHAVGHPPLPGSPAARLCSLLAAFLMDYGLLGGTFVFFDTSGMHYSLPALTLHSYVWHILLIAIGCYSGLCKETDHSWRGYLFSTILYLVCCGIATVFNLAFYRYGTINMFYISPHYHMQQKVFRQVGEALGNCWGIAAYISASIAGAGMIHLFWRRAAKRALEIRKARAYNKTK